MDKKELEKVIKDAYDIFRSFNDLGSFKKDDYATLKVYDLISSANKKINSENSKNE